MHRLLGPADRYNPDGTVEVDYLPHAHDTRVGELIEHRGATLVVTAVTPVLDYHTVTLAPVAAEVRP